MSLNPRQPAANCPSTKEQTPMPHSERTDHHLHDIKDSVSSIHICLHHRLESALIRFKRLNRFKRLILIIPGKKKILKWKIEVRGYDAQASSRVE